MCSQARRSLNPSPQRLKVNNHIFWLIDIAQLIFRLSSIASYMKLLQNTKTNSPTCPTGCQTIKSGKPDRFNFSDTRKSKSIETVQKNQLEFHLKYNRQDLFIFKACRNKEINIKYFFVIRIIQEEGWLNQNHPNKGHLEVALLEMMKKFLLRGL